MHKWYANFSRFAKRSGPSWKTITVVLILLKAFGVHFKVLSSFKRRNEGVSDKNYSYRLRKGEQKHFLNQNNKISRI